MKMKMNKNKKLIALLLAGVLTASLVGCGRTTNNSQGEQSSQEQSLPSTTKSGSGINELADLNGKVIGYGYMPGVTDEEIINYFNDSNNISIDSVLGIPDASAKFMALINNKVDAIDIPSCEAEYYMKNNSGYKIIDQLPNSSWTGHMLFPKEKTSLRDDVNQAIGTLKENGILDALTDTYVTNPVLDKEFPAVEMPKFDGKPTYSIAITGITVPFDIIDVNGEPSGFNVAIMSEIAKILEVNFTIPTYEYDSALQAIEANKIDGIFIYGVSADEDASGGNFNENYIFSDPYAYFGSWCFLVKE